MEVGRAVLSSQHDALAVGRGICRDIPECGTFHSFHYPRLCRLATVAAIQSAGDVHAFKRRRATKVLFGSAHFRELFLQQCPVPREKTAVIYRTSAPTATASADPTVEARYGIQRPYLLSVSHLQPYKNLTELITGYEVARRQGALAGVQLVIAGGAYGGARYVQRIKSLARQLALGPTDLRLVGDVPHADVQHLLAGCDAFVFSSTCENCPTSLVEALALGRPIACSQLSSMPEIAGNAALYFNPYAPAEIALALARLYETPGLKQVLAARASGGLRNYPVKRKSRNRRGKRSARRRISRKRHGGRRHDSRLARGPMHWRANASKVVGSGLLFQASSTRYTLPARVTNSSLG